jgi:hypothetical protein
MVNRIDRTDLFSLYSMYQCSVRWHDKEESEMVWKVVALVMAVWGGAGGDMLDGRKRGGCGGSQAGRGVAVGVEGGPWVLCCGGDLSGLERGGETAGSVRRSRRTILNVALFL